MTNELSRIFKTDLSTLSRPVLKSKLTEYMIDNYHNPSIDVNNYMKKSNNNNHHNNRNNLNRNNNNQNNIRNRVNRVPLMPSRWGPALPGAVPIPL